MDPNSRRITLDRLRREAAEVVRKLRTGDDTVLVVEGDVPVAVMVSPEAFKRLQQERELLRYLTLGELESVAGTGVPLDDVLDDCDLLLEEN